ncbi:MAG TPA: FecR domain-containing protein [Steroidobacteraceae bacterium]|nr:FecR domain-containing protein [Steroidobacteraceae bacterium]
MTSQDEQVRAAIAEQASEWFVANDEMPLRTQDAAALVAWLKASPAHIEEFLGVASIARDLHMAGAGPELSVEALVARAQAEESDPVRAFGSRALAAVKDTASRRWRPVAVTAAAVGVVILGSLLVWSLRPVARVAAPAQGAALHFETRHGEQRTYRLADNSVLHLNTDSAATVRYSEQERLIVLTSGEAELEVAHEPRRALRVLAGSAAVVDLGTEFDVRLGADSTVVTVVAGHVAVVPSPLAGRGGTGSSQSRPPSAVELGANQQVSITEGRWPASPVTVDAKHATAWLHRQIAFDHEPLERVAAEFNRYSPKPIEITAPKLRELEVSGTFSTDDPEEFIAFLRSLEGVRVEVTATRIRVSHK